MNALAVQTVAVAQVMIATALMAFIWGLMDREPPITLVSVIPAAARPGEVVTIRAKVVRDLTRGCEAEISRYMFALTDSHSGLDAVEARFVLGKSSANHSMIAMMERTWPNGLVISERVPDSVVPGPAKITADINYYCNKAHRMAWPITVHMELPFTVLP